MGIPASLIPVSIEAIQLVIRSIVEYQRQAGKTDCEIIEMLGLARAESETRKPTDLKDV